jgi:hypothetical protein
MELVTGAMYVERELNALRLALCKLLGWYAVSGSPNAGTGRLDRMMEIHAGSLAVALADEKKIESCDKHFITNVVKEEE